MAQEGTVRVVVYGGDQQLYRGKRARVLVRTLESTGPVTVMDEFTKQSKDPIYSLTLPADRGLSYIVTVSASGYQDTANVFKAKSGKNIEVRNMLVPKNPELDLSGFSFDKLKQVSRAFYDALDKANITESAFRKLAPENIAGALNIEAKLRGTTLMGASAVEFIREFDGKDKLEQDRIYARIDTTLVDMLAASTAFRKSLLNAGNHPGFPVSYRQTGSFGLLQFSLSDKSTNGLMEADIDIDLYPWPEPGHIIEVLHNKLRNRINPGTGKTDPFTVYSLIFNQGISPLYTLA